MNDPLNIYRSQIDAIDAQIVALLKERIAVVQKVAQHKQQETPHLYPIRPAREAQMLRNIAASFEGSAFSAATATAIWRLIIGASTAAEAPLTLSVYCVDQKEDCFWLAREYFGPAATFIRQSQIKRVISDVLEGKAAIGVVPCFSADDTSHWWASMVQPAADAPKIFARLPFIIDAEAEKEAPSAFAFAKVPPEHSNDDCSIVVLQTHHDLSQHRLQTAFAAAALEAKWHGITSLQPDTRLHLVELAGFITGEHDGFTHFTQTLGDALQHVTFLGAYATPFAIPYHERKNSAHGS